MFNRIDEIAKKAVDHFGSTAQLAKTFEEIGELIAAVGRNVDGKSADAVVDEIADVTIMIRQMRLLYGATVVDARIEHKLKRLESRMGNK